MILRLSIPARQALAKLTLPVLIAASFGLMLLGKADTLLAERLRMALADSLAPIYVAISGPLHDLRSVAADATGLIDLRAENVRLRAENETLRRWQSIALALDAENQRLKANLHWLPDPTPSYVTARVVADAGGVYARAVLLSVGPGHGVTRGEIALDARGLVGRVTEVGARTARVLLITDLNSRIPVVLEGSRAHAIMVGTNGPRPRLMYWPEGVMPAEGERVVTSAEASAFPANLPIGTVHYSASNVPEVEPLAQLDRLEIVRIFDYGLHSQLDAEAAPDKGARSSAGGTPAAGAGRH
ncbi:rod shape-determining protein MreC [Acidisphaera rubrifaciens HS-AP3]|uniref:Cell shape-determining protein MreC n=1 Tax=Acidisphaera rubrifaciens HS-AP3 TaxID=1231350 RepID=A0A0D6P778_9PROT|nr:rod shape-determining protein MreC [Acidisphaera rubrifaciens]GAN77181.1 rod shape-determining protein MreC [Acidisphaera rubrifaciens HS-AP3]